MHVYEMVAPGIDGLRIAERTEAKLQSHEVRIQILAMSINFRDLILVRGELPLAYPRIPLADAVGTVLEIGSAVESVAVGDRVCPIYYPDWQSGPVSPEKLARDRGASYDGVATERLVLPASELVKVPAHLTDAQAASLPCAGVTAWSAVMANGGNLLGRRVLVQGTGGVSVFALQFARAAGAEVYLLSSSDEKLVRAETIGASHVVNYRKSPQWSSEILEMTNGEGVDLVVDVGGNDTLMQSLLALRSSGRISLVGFLGGQSGTFPVVPMLAKGAHIEGIVVGGRDAFEAMNAAIDLHRIGPVVDRHFAWDALPEALRSLEGQGHFGKIVVGSAG